MKTTFWTLAAAALLLAGCSKEELTENMTEGGSLVATSSNGSARLGAAGNQPSVKFKNGRIVIGLNNTKTEEEVPLDAILSQGGGSVVLTNHETSPPMVFELPLENTNGNGNQRYRTPQFEMGADMEGELFEIAVNGPDGAYLWGANIFVREDGKAVENDPKFKRGRIGRWNFDDAAAQDQSNARLTIVVADDPLMTVSEVSFVKDGTLGDPNDPTTGSDRSVIHLQQTHFNQAIGLSRWVGQVGCQGYYNAETGEWVCEDDCPFDDLESRPRVIFKSNTNYHVDFLSEDQNKTIVAVYEGGCDDEDNLQLEPSDEPEILGSRLGSTSFGEQWQLEIAIADLDDWVETVNYVFTPSDGPSPLVAELPMQLTRTEGNLRVYTSPKFSFNGNPTGNDVGGIVYMYGTGTRSTAGTAKQKAELL